MFCFKLLPPFGGLTELGMGVMGVFLGIVYGWTFCTMVWPSMMAIVALGFSGFTTVNASIVNYMGHSNVLLVFTMLLLISFYTNAGITKILAFKIINLKIGRGKPWLLSFLIIYGTVVLTGCSNLYASIFIMYGVWNEICELYKIDKFDKYSSFMMGGITFACIMAGGQSWPWKAPVVAFMGAYQNVGGVDYHDYYLQYIIYMWSMHFIFCVFFTLIGKFILRLDASKLANVNSNLVEEQGKLDSYQKFMIAVFGVMLFCLLVPGIVTNKTGFIKLLSDLGTTGVGLVLISFLLIVNHVRGENLKKLIFDGVNFDVLFLIGAVMGLSAAMSAKDTGISIFLTNLLSPIFADNGKITFLILVTLVPICITGFLNNTVIGMLFIPIAYTFAEAIGGINHFSLAIMLCNLCSCAMLTAAGCPLTAVMLGQKEYMNAKRCFAIGWVAIAAVWIPSFISIPFANMLFVY